jgi:hypothetical protein
MYYKIIQDTSEVLTQKLHRKPEISTLECASFDCKHYQKRQFVVRKDSRHLRHGFGGSYSVRNNSYCFKYSTEIIYIYKEKERQCTYKLNTETRSGNQCCRGKAVSIIYSECVSVALVIQQANKMRHITFSSPAWLALSYFSTLSHKRRNFRRKRYWIQDVF